MKKGRAHTMTHDYKRHGTTTLFAALNTLDGSVIAACMEHHRHQEWLKFLRLIDHQTPADKQLHLIVDNYATHKHPVVQRWAARHKRFHFHYTPTSGSWLNMVERFFRDLTESQLRRGVFTSVELYKNASSLISKNIIANPNPLSGPQRPPTFSKRSNAPKPSSITAHLCDAVH
jgi:transposase